MGRAQDLARVAKGASKVAQALLSAEGPVVAARCIKLREHGVGLGTSLKDAVSSAVSGAASPTHPPQNESRPILDASNTDGTFGSVGNDGVNINGSDAITMSARPATAFDPGAVDRKAAVENRTALREEGASLHESSSVEVATMLGVDESSSTEQPSKESFSAKLSGEKDAKRGGEETIQNGASETPALPGGAKVEIRQEGPTLKASPKVSWDESGPWTFANPGNDDSAVGIQPNQSGKPEASGGSQANGKKNGMSGSRTRSVPSSPLARVFGFGQLAAGLAMGTVAEAVRQSVGGGGADGGSGQSGAGGTQGRNVKKYVVSDANAERLAETLCRMRGAALKLGQMLSIQDESVIPPSLAKALDRVRQGADIMPARQLNKQLEKSFGTAWRSRLAAFDEVPIAAASIGQVHRAKLLDGTEVAMKIQYPGVADSVESDLTNLHRLVQLTNILPPGLYIEEIIKVAREELGEECDYEREAVNQERFRGLVDSDPNLSKWASVPRVVPELLSKEVLTTHLATGVPVDQVLPMPQAVRNHVARLMLRCTINELFDWRFMQTDPNWGNFLFDRNTGKMSLIDFGACREYRKDFVDDYLKLVWAAANRDEAEIMRVSKELQFLTGDETAAMMQAHVQAGLVVGEPFVDKSGGTFDFHGSNMTSRLSQHGDTFMKHRLTPPPREAYSLHRKLAGAFLMNIKLEAKVPCRDILEDVYERYTFS